MYEKLRRAAQKEKRLKEEEIKKSEKELANYPDKIFKSADGTHWGVTKDGIYHHYKSLPNELLHRVAEQSPIKPPASAPSKKVAISVDDVIDKIVESPSIIKNISKENAKKLVLAVQERFKDDKELVGNFTALVENSVDLVEHKTKAQKLQSKIARELALKTQTQVLKKAGFSPKYIEKYQKSETEQNDRSTVEKDSRKLVESLRPAEKAARIIDESMGKSHKPATDADKWLHRALSEVADPTRERHNSLEFEEIKTEAQSRPTDKKSKKLGKKAGVMLLSLLLRSVFEKTDNKTNESTNFNPAALKKGFTNPISNSNKIYTLESIRSMTESELKKHKKAISYQKQTIGIPTRKEAEKETAKGGLVYVKAYTRNDGVNVKSYYRARPN